MNTIHEKQEVRNSERDVNARNNRWTIVGRLIASCWVLFIIYCAYMGSQTHDRDNCYYDFSLHAHSVKGVLFIIDTTVDRSGVGFFVVDSVKMESYDFWSDSLLALYRKGALGLGDSVFKNSHTRFGRIKTSSTLLDSVELRSYNEICDEYTEYQRAEVMRQYPVSFKR